MPARVDAQEETVRIRQIKPDYWLDRDLHTRLTPAQREFYIALWMLADDAGYLVWDLPTIAAQVYPWRSRKRREADASTYVAALKALDTDDPHLVVFDCGHALVPKLVRHQKFGGRPVYTHRDSHLRADARDCARVRADAPHGIGRVGEGNGKVGGGMGGPFAFDPDKGLVKVGE